jgi:chromosome segregation ATPase
LTRDTAKQSVTELQSALTKANSQLEAERGKLTAEQDHASDLANEIRTLKDSLKEADHIREERDKQHEVIETLKRGVDLATQTTAELRERLKAQELSHQTRESNWLSDREKRALSMHDAQSERDRAQATKAELEKRYTDLEAQSHQAKDEYRQATTALSEQVATLKAHIAGKQETVERLEKQMDRNESKLEAMNKENRELNRQNSALNQHLQATSSKKP